MKSILVVDPGSRMTKLLSRAKETIARSIDVLTVTSVQDVLQVLRTRTVSMVVADLNLSAAKGLKLTAFIRKTYPHVRILVVNDVITPALKARIQLLGSARCVATPMVFETIGEEIKRFGEEGIEGWISGISVANFLQLMEMEKKTCTLKVSKDGATGLLHVRQGELIAAEKGGLRNEAAAYEIIGWDAAAIAVTKAVARQREEIRKPLLRLLLESQRIKDEQGLPEDSHPGLVRKYSRQACRLPVEIDLKDWSFPSIIENISVGGVYIATAEPVYVGQAVDVHLPLTHDQPLSVLPGSVVWRNSAGIGVAFKSIPKAERRRIISLVKVLREGHAHDLQRGRLATAQALAK